MCRSSTPASTQRLRAKIRRLSPERLSGERGPSATSRKFARAASGGRESSGNRPKLGCGAPMFSYIAIDRPARRTRAARRRDDTAEDPPIASQMTVEQIRTALGKPTTALGDREVDLYRARAAQLRDGLSSAAAIGNGQQLSRLPATSAMSTRPTRLSQRSPDPFPFSAWDWLRALRPCWPAENSVWLYARCSTAWPLARSPSDLRF